MKTETSRNLRFSSEEIAGFCTQMAIILKGGIPIYEGVYILSEEIEEKQSKEVLNRMNEALKENQSFYAALKETKAFPAYMMSMVKIGEATGKLEAVLESLAVYYERESTMKASIRNVISYPLMMFTMMAVVLLVLVIKILPMFERVFHELSVDVASTSSRAMQFGLLTGKIVAVITLAIFCIAIFLIVWYQTQPGKNAMDHFITKFALTKRLSAFMATGKFVSSMSVMISSGLDVQEALEMAVEVVQHKGIKKKVEACIELVKEDVSLEEALRKTKLISGMQGRMVSVAAKTGVLDVVFGELSKQFDEKIESRLSVMCSRIETILVVSLSLVVGAVLVSIMLPLVSIISAIA